MGTASSYSPCGCRWTRLLEHPDNIWIEWVRCAEHHNPKVDDAMILNAAKNRRVYEGGNGEYEPAPFNVLRKNEEKNLATALSHAHARDPLSPSPSDTAQDA
jgi:hypothetical protein